MSKTYILAESWREASKWARSGGRKPITDYAYVSRAIQLRNLPPDADFVMLPGFFMHPEWELMSEQLHRQGVTVDIIPKNA